MLNFNYVAKAIKTSYVKYQSGSGTIKKKKKSIKAVSPPQPFRRGGAGRADRPKRGAGRGHSALRAIGNACGRQLTSAECSQGRTGHRTVSSPSARSTRVPGRGRPPPSQPRSSFPPPARGDVLPAAAEGPGPEAEGEPGPGAARWRPEPGPVSGTARMSEPELLLDSNIRLWVVLPIVFITFFVGMIRHYVSILLQSDKRLTQEQVSDRSGPPPSGPPRPRTPRPPENLAPPPRTCLSPGSPGPLPPAGRRGQRQARSRLRPCR